MPPSRSPSQASPPLPLLRYIDLMVAVAGDAEILKPDSTALQTILQMGISDSRRSILRRSVGEVRQALTEEGNGPLPPMGVSDAAILMVGMGLVAQTRHLLAYWAPVMEMGRAGTFSLHLEDLRTAQARIQTMDGVLIHTEGEEARELLRQLSRLHGELAAGFPDPILRKNSPRSVHTPTSYGSALRGGQVYSSQTLPITPPPETALTRERKAFEDRQGIARWIVLGLLLCGLGIFLAFFTKREVDPRVDGYYRRFAPVVRVSRKPLMFEVEMEGVFLDLTQKEQMGKLEDLLDALDEEKGSFTVVEITVGGQPYGRWDGGTWIFSK